MIERAVGGAVSLLLAAGAAKVIEPVTWHFFGAPFEVPAMIAGLFGCIVTRVIVGQSDKVSRWMLRLSIDVLTGGVTFFLVLSTRPALLTALVLGITIAAMGATIIKLAEVRGRRILDALLPGGDEPAIDRAMERLHQEPDPRDIAGG